MTEFGYSVWQDRAWKRWGRGRLRQYLRVAQCALSGHRWRDWQTDDYDGPGELLVPGDPDSFMPYFSRPARDGEFATRSCRHCRATEMRRPL